MTIPAQSARRRGSFQRQRRDGSAAGKASPILAAVKIYAAAIATMNDPSGAVSGAPIGSIHAADQIAEPNSASHAIHSHACSRAKASEPIASANKYPNNAQPLGWSVVTSAGVRKPPTTLSSARNGPCRIAVTAAATETPAIAAKLKGGVRNP